MNEPNTTEAEPALSDNVVPMPESEKQPPTREMEEKRKIFQRAAEIIMHSLERDALQLEKAGLLGEHTIQRRHELMDTARCIRVTMTWMAGPQAEPKEP